MGTLETTRRMAASLRSTLTPSGRRDAIRARLGKLPEGGFEADPQARIPRQAGADRTTPGEDRREPAADERQDRQPH